ncbi:MAG: hypothetical protein ACRCS9_05425 [Hyphomicrobium sp.]
MLDVTLPENLLRVAILAMPFLVLATLFLIWRQLVSRRSRAVSTKSKPAAHAPVANPAAMVPRATPPFAPPMASTSPSAVAATASPVHAALAMPPRATETEAAPAVALLSPTASTPPAANAAAISADIAAREAEGDRAATPPLYLALGRLLQSDGDVAKALTAFRSAAGLAAKHRLDGIHAEARLELAEAAFVAGDLTTACEHWQIARMAFLDGGAKPAADGVDRRMRSHGCPTDWVLTDF